MTASCLYSGWVMHRRLKPRQHRFRYRAWWMLIDLDDLASIDARLRFFSCDRFNLVAFHARDHGHDIRPLRAQIEDRVQSKGIDLTGGSIRLLCMPRILGYAFNPLSIYFCHDRTGSLAALVYEVHNTFGERHSYTVSVWPRADGTYRHRHAKQFHVSPFMAMDMAYDFRVSLQPDHALTVAIAGSDANGAVIQAVLQAEQRPLTDRQLFRLLATHRLMTLKVIAAIHWQALRLWRKGIRLHPHPGQVLPAVSGNAQTTREKTAHARL